MLYRGFHRGELIANNELDQAPPRRVGAVFAVVGMHIYIAKTVPKGFYGIELPKLGNGAGIL